MTIDDLVDQVNDQVEEDRKENLLEDLGANSVEDLELLEDKLQYISQALVHYDKRVEDIEKRVVTLERLMAKMIEETVEDDESDNTGRFNWEQ